MKKIKILLYALVLASTYYSCDSALDVEVAGQVSPADTFLDISGVRKNFYGVLSTLTTSNQILFNSVFTDEIGIGRANGGQGVSAGEDAGLYNYVLVANSTKAEQIWNSTYRSINQFSRFIASATAYMEGDITAAEAAEVKQLIAEVRVLRAFAHNELLTYYSEDMKDDSSLGVILVDDIPVVETPHRPRSTTGEVYTFIMNELNDAYAVLDDSFIATRQAGSPTYYVTKNFVDALRSRISLYRGKYNDAIIYANNVTTQVATISTYPNVFKDTAVNGVIFKLARVNGDERLGALWSSLAVDGSLFYEVGRSLFNSFEEHDIRKSVCVYLQGAIISSDPATEVDYLQKDVLPVGKYPSKTSVNQLADIKVFRAAELSLIKAEAYIMLNQIANAENEINALRAERVYNIDDDIYYPITLGTSQRDNLRILLEERRKELAFEGFRWVDMRRLNVLAEVYFDRYFRDCEYNNSCNTYLGLGDYRYVMPIPATEVGINKVMIQNPGY